MSKVTKERQRNPEVEPMDSEVVAFRAQFEARSSLDEIVHDGARRMLQAAIEAEADDFIRLHADRVDECNGTPF